MIKNTHGFTDVRTHFFASNILIKDLSEKSFLQISPLHHKMSLQEEPFFVIKNHSLLIENNEEGISREKAKIRLHPVFLKQRDLLKTANASRNTLFKRALWENYHACRKRK